MGAEILDEPLGHGFPRLIVADRARKDADTWQDIETSEGDPAVGTERSTKRAYADNTDRLWQPRVDAPETMSLLGR